MARPPKDPKLRMDTDLRIPVTGDQKRLIAEAASEEPAGMAAWARSVLLEAAAKSRPGTGGRVNDEQVEKLERVASEPGRLQDLLRVDRQSARTRSGLPDA
jgi:hypothetical protein